jgi:hypothetical protein
LHDVLVLPFASSAVLVIGKPPGKEESRSNAVRVVELSFRNERRDEGVLRGGAIWTVLLQFPLEKTDLSDEVNEGL